MLLLKEVLEVVHLCILGTLLQNKQVGVPVVHIVLRLGHWCCTSWCCTSIEILDLTPYNEVNQMALSNMLFSSSNNIIID